MATEQSRHQHAMALIGLAAVDDREAMDMFLADLDSDERGRLASALAIAYAISLSSVFGEHAEMFFATMRASMFTDEDM